MQSLVRCAAKAAAIWLVLTAFSCHAEDLYSFGYDRAQTVGGEVSASFNEAGEMQVKLVGKVLLTKDDGNVDWYIVSAYPITERARLVLLGGSSGNNWCRASHRVLEVRSDGSYMLTGDFGGCEPHDAVNKVVSFKEQIALNNPKYIRGEWHIGLDKYNEKAKKWERVWFIYRDGKVYFNGKVVSRSQ